MTPVRRASVLTTLTEGIRIALDSLRTSKTRAALTIVGVAIGVMVVMGMSAAVRGINTSFNQAIEQVGPKTFFVFRYFQGGIQVGDNRNAPWRHYPPITQAEAKLIAGLPAIRDVIMAEDRQTGVQAGTESEDNVQITGAGPAWPQVNGGEVTFGRSFTNLEAAAGDKVVILNTKLAVRLFGQLNPVGQPVKIMGQEFRVIGVYEPPPNLFGGGNDFYLIMPWLTFHRYMNVNWGWARLAVLPTNEATVSDAMDEVTAALRRERQLRPGQENTFTIVTQDKFLSMWNQLTGVFFVVMIALSGVGLMVGGVGVVAVMMISVTERTREIGVRKALGATQGEILWQFLVEAATLTLVGGAVGMILGGGLAFAVSHLTPVPAQVPPLAIVVALAASILTGVVFGIVPAQRAARMDPVESLRYE
jgi:putative ABC transport system permease protein